MKKKVEKRVERKKEDPRRKVYCFIFSGARSYSFRRVTPDPQCGSGDEKGKQYHDKSSPETTRSSFSGSLLSHPRHISISVDHCRHQTSTPRRRNPQSTTPPPVGHHLHRTHLAAPRCLEPPLPYMLWSSSSPPSFPAR
jgi:hypothetical protein